jgi:hypothetical protein
MAYDLMLLADPGPARDEVRRVFEAAPDIRPDATLQNRYWLTTSHGEIALNVGSKDPVESIHLEVVPEEIPYKEAVTVRALELAGELDMQLEDMLWGHAVTRETLDELRAFWRNRAAHSPAASAPRSGSRPWWRIWA